MVHHAWVFVLVLIVGLCLVLLPHSGKWKPNDRSSKGNRRHSS